jgi:transposase
MAYPIQTKERAIRLRKSGYSIKEIAKILNIGIGTSSLWLRNITLNNMALQRLQSRVSLGHHLANESRKPNAIIRNEFIQQQAND